MRLIFMLPCLIVLLSWLWPLPLPPVAKLSFAALILIGTNYHFWSRLSSGSQLLPEFPRPIILLFNWVFGTIMFLALFQLALDLVALLLSAIYWHWQPISVTARKMIALTAASLAGFAVLNAIQTPKVRNVTVTIPNLPQAFEGYRLLQLSDLHLTRLFTSYWAKAVVTQANAVNADVIVVTGDFIDGSVALRQADIAPLSNLRAPDGVFAIPGNHEYYYGYTEWLDHISGLGITWLLNTHTLLTRNDTHLALAGLTDRSAPRHQQASPDLKAALANIPSQTPIILLDHQPQNATEAAHHGVALQLSGHTHGGMILGLDRIVARANKGFVSGLYKIGTMTLYVSNGTGLWPGFALRLGVPSEMTCFHLKAK